MTTEMLRSTALRIAALLTTLAASVLTTAADTIEIKLATVAPRGSSWHGILEDMGAAWSEATDGQVKLKIYAGTLGDEDDIMRRIRIGQLDAAAVTTAGLSTIDAAPLALGIPLAYRSSDELDYVREQLAPKLDQILLENGFIVLNWGDAGWVRFFSKSAVVRPDDLKQHKLFVWASGSAIDRYWKDAGFKPVPLSAVDVLPALQTGMITAIPTTPIAALANQWFPATKFMSDLRWAPLVGATVVTKKKWERIPAALRPELLRIGRETGVRLREEIRRLEGSALAVLDGWGVETVAVPADAHREWRALTDSVYPKLRGQLIGKEIFDEALAHRDEFRKRASENGSADGDEAPAGGE